MDVKRIAKILEGDNELIIRQTVLDKAQENNQIIYGARAINRQLPKYLEKETEDYDILTPKPKKSAKELVKELNRRVGDQEFKVVSARHKGTYKVQDSNGKTIVDYTQMKRMPKVKTSWGNKFYDIKSIKKNIQRSLKKKGNEFRREKDLDSLKRITLSEEMFNF